LLPVAGSNRDRLSPLDRAPSSAATHAVKPRNTRFKFKRTKGRGRRIAVSGGDVKVFDERVAGEESARTIGLQSESLGLATLPRLSDREGGREIRRVAELFATFRVFDVDVGAARRPSPMGSTALEEDASNLAAFLYYLREQDGSFQDLEQDACAMIPGLQAIEFDSVGGPTEAVAVRLRTANKMGQLTLSRLRWPGG